MKIFVSYSRRDADLAQHVHEYFLDSEHEIFTDVNNIQMGDIWSNIIENNISRCDIFVVIVTHASLRSVEIEREVLQAQRENKTIMPCIHRDVSHGEIKWDLAKYQGIEFEDKYELGRKLFSKTEKSKQKSHKVEGIGSNISSVSKNIELDKNIQPKEALGDKMLDSSQGLATSRDSVGNSTGPIIPQTQSQQESPIPEKEVLPAPPSESKSPVPPTSEASTASTRSSSPLLYPHADSINSNMSPPQDRSNTTSAKKTSYYYRNQEAIEEKRSGFNLKIVLPIIGVVAIVGALVAFSFLGSGNPPEQVTPEGESATTTTPPVSPPTEPASNAIPIASNRSVTTNVDTPINIALAASDNDTNDDLTAHVVSNPSSGKLNDIDQSTGLVTYTPKPGFLGKDQFTFKVNDGKADSSNIGIVDIVVTGQAEQPAAASAGSNHPPIPTNQSVTTDMNTPIDITLDASDQDANDDLTATIVTNPLHGSLGEVNQSSGVVVYTPNVGFTGDDDFTFKVNDGKADSNSSAKVSITVTRALH